MMMCGVHSAQCPACRETHYVLAASLIVVGIILFTVLTPVWLTLLAANNAVNQVKEPPEPPTFSQFTLFSSVCFLNDILLSYAIEEAITD